MSNSSGPNCLQRLSWEEIWCWSTLPAAADGDTRQDWVIRSVQVLKGTQVNPFHAIHDIDCLPNDLLFSLLKPLLQAIWIPDQTAPLGAVWSGVHSVCFHNQNKSEVHSNVCNRRKKQTIFSGQEIIGSIRVNDWVDFNTDGTRLQAEQVWRTENCRLQMTSQLLIKRR